MRVVTKQYDTQTSFSSSALTPTQSSRSIKRLHAVVGAVAAAARCLDLSALLARLATANADAAIRLLVAVALVGFALNARRSAFFAHLRVLPF